MIKVVNKSCCCKEDLKFRKRVPAPFSSFQEGKEVKSLNGLVVARSDFQIKDNFE